MRGSARRGLTQSAGGLGCVPLDTLALGLKRFRTKDLFFSLDPGTSIFDHDGLCRLNLSRQFPAPVSVAQSHRRRRWGASLGNEAIPTPDVSRSRHQALTGQQRLLKGCRLTGITCQTDLGQAALQRVGGGYMTRQWLDTGWEALRGHLWQIHPAAGGCWIFAKAGRQPVTERRCQRPLLPGRNLDPVDQRIAGSCLGGTRQHGIKPLRFGNQSAEGADRCLFCLTRWLNCRHGKTPRCLSLLIGGSCCLQSSVSAGRSF